MQKILLIPTAAAMVLSLPQAATAQSNSCSIDELAGVYESRYGNIDCKTSGSTLDCCYSGSCRYDLNLTLTSGGEELIGKWDHGTGRTGTAQFSVTEDCGIGDGAWGEGTAAPTTLWTVGEKVEDYGPSPVVGPTCASQSECGAGFYCAFDRTCHPDSHLPLQDIQLPAGTAPYELTPVTETRPEPELQAQPEADSGSQDGPLPRGPIPTGAPSLTGIAGVPGEVQFVMDFEDGFLNGLYWTENNSNPCSFLIRGWRLSQDASSDDREELRRQAPTGCPASSSQLLASEHRVALDRPTESAIGRVEVCNASGERHRMKGIRAWGSWITDEGTALYINDGQSHSVQGCDEWSSSMLCGDGRIATGVVLYANERNMDDSNSGSITGLRLICRTLGVR